MTEGKRSDGFQVCLSVIESHLQGLDNLQGLLVALQIVTSSLTGGNDAFQGGLSVLPAVLAFSQIELRENGLVHESAEVLAWNISLTNSNTRKQSYHRKKSTK
jgi:hypothetical protein